MTANLLSRRSAGRKLVATARRAMREADAIVNRTKLRPGEYERLLAGALGFAWLGGVLSGEARQ